MVGEVTTLVAGNVGITPISAGENADSAMIDAAIRLMTFNILVGILYGGNSENDEKRKNNETGGNGGELGEKLQDSDTKEEADDRLANSKKLK